MKELSLRVTEGMIHKAIEGHGYTSTPQKIKDVFEAILESRHFDVDSLLNDAVEYAGEEKDWK